VVAADTNEQHPADWDEKVAAVVREPGSAVPRRSRTADIRQLPRQMAKRFSWGLADQAVSSLTNSALSIYIARELGAVAFGAFSLAYVTYSFVLNASRGLGTDPLVVRFSATDVKTWRRAVACSSGTALGVGITAGACSLGAAMLLSGTARLAFLALGLTLPGLMLQDSWRYAFFAAGRGRLAFINDSIWAFSMVPALIWLRKSGNANVFSFVLVWGAAACLAAAIGPLQARVIPRLSAIRAWVTRHRDLGARYLAENTSNSAANQLRTYGVGLILNLAAVGYVQASSTLMGPFMVVLMGISLVTVPEAARMLRRSTRALRLYCIFLGIGLAAAAMGWGLALMVLLPHGLGEWLLKGLWRPTYPLVMPVTVSIAGACVVAGASAGLRALGASRRSLRSQVVMSIMYVVFGLAGAEYHGAVGTTEGVALAVWLAAGVWWWQLRTALREAPAPGSSAPGGSAPGGSAPGGSAPGGSTTGSTTGSSAPVGGAPGGSGTGGSGSGPGGKHARAPRLPDDLQQRDRAQDLNLEGS
jgi:O-antigen/teichoic acid export membrane protein